MPFILVLIRSAINFKKRDSDLEGMTVVVMGFCPAVNETTIDPNLELPSVTETKHPFSNFRICKEKLRPSQSTVFAENPLGKLNKF